MIASLNIANEVRKVDLSKAIDISIPLIAGEGRARAWYVDGISIEPVRSDEFTGSVQEGGSVNFRNISFNPHGNGTHTECLGHITPEVYSVNKSIRQFFSLAKVISIQATQGFNDPDFSSQEDLILSFEAIKDALGGERPDALIIRTLPNEESKCSRNWSQKNWPQLDKRAAAYFAEIGIKHLLIDLPSVDREMDGGKLLSHHAFWQVPENPRMDASITELIFVPDEVQDGEYLLELQFAPFENDASPSRPVLYRFL